MSFSNDQTKLGLTTAATATTSTVAPLTTGNILNTATTSTPSPFIFTCPQFNTTQPIAPSTNTPSTNTTTGTTGFTPSTGLLGQLKTPVVSNIATTNLLGGDKKLCTTTSGTTTSATGLQTTSVTQAQVNITSSFLSAQANTGDKQTSQMTYEELETTVNKLIGKLTDNEEEFSKMAREMNDWDKAINENYEKLLLLTETVKAVKAAQVKLSYDLDFIAIEHKDFESIVSAWEKDVDNFNFTQPSRQDVYQKAVSVDIQVRKMCEDLREVIEHLNDRLKFSESDDPVMQIGRVLNAHMESLKWVDESTTQIYDYISYLSQIQEQMKKNLPQIGN